MQTVSAKSVLSLTAMAVMLGWSAMLPSAAALDPNMVRISADHQSYNMERKMYALRGKVNVAYQDIQISGVRADVDLDEVGQPSVAYFYDRPLFKRIKPNEGEDRMQGDQINLYLGTDRFGAKGNVESYFTTVAADPFTIRSDVQEFDNRNRVMAASGNVRVLYQGSEAFSQLANVRMKTDGKAERVIFSGNAKIKQETSEIKGGRITVMVDSGNLIAENKVNTRVDLKDPQPNNPDKVFITSDYQQYDKATDTMIASGNVKIVYGDYVAVGPKATFKLTKNDLDRIFLTGRPTITENGRTITADKITITTNPKNFDAVGNVKVNFKQSGSGGGTPPAKPAGQPGTLPVDDPSDY